MCNLIHKGLIKSHTGLTPDCSYGWWMDQRVELKSQPIHIDCCAKLATQINCCTRWRALHDLIAIRLSLLFGYSWPKKRETACYTTWSTTQHLNLHSSLEDSYPMKRPYCPTHWFPLYMVFNRIHITEIVMRKLSPIRWANRAVSWSLACYDKHPSVLEEDNLVCLQVMRDKVLQAVSCLSYGNLGTPTRSN